ncbi:NlpC/P60 family protein [Planococcus sp. YIM B11945]|uniref:C40 family peptidase n=1 Tax=Planococcus sp. YIM B11945 TaxID=3435410 RepID=UPI003D7C4CCA
MRKLIFTVLAASSLILSTSASDIKAANHPQSNAEISAVAYEATNNDYTMDIEQVAASKAVTMSGNYKTKANTNIRQDAGTAYKVVTVAKKGTTVTATHKKTVGKETWYKVKVGSKTGWVLSSLVSKVAAAPAVTTKTGSFTTKSNVNIRKDAGTNFGIVMTAKKGAKVTATHQKKVGSATWYKVKAGSKTGWVLSSLVTPLVVKKAANTVSNAKVVQIGLSLQGIPYVFGGTTTKGFDCSGFTQYVFKQAGKNISRTTLTQFAETKQVTTPEPGDLIFFAGTYRAGISHVGIYIGNGQFVHSGGAKSEVRSVNDSYWKKYFHSYRTF